MEDAWEAYQDPKTAIRWDEQLQSYTAPLTPQGQQAIAQLRLENQQYKRLDPTVLYGIYTAREAFRQAGWETDNFGINIGSSRGATQLFEQYYDAFAKTETAATISSPSTTLGNISSWVAQDLKSKGPDISHSITCSTALHAVLNGVAWLQSGMVDRFMVGGAEASLTPFTIAQIKAMKLTPSKNTFHSSDGEQHSEFPCLALDFSKKQNTMVLGEGAGMACLEAGASENALAYISGIGYATEKLEHAASLSANGSCFQKSMTMALEGIDPSTVDVVIMHAPGTIKGDLSEFEAVKTVFCNKLPVLTTNKWKIGHTFGASGLLSMAMAVQLLQHQKFISTPYLDKQLHPYTIANADRKINTVLINAVGFGGNAVSILLTR